MVQESHFVNGSDARLGLGFCIGDSETPLEVFLGQRN